MSRKLKIALISFLVVALIAWLAFYFTPESVVVLDSKGVIGVQQRNLIYIVSSLMLIVVFPALFLTLFFAWKYREGRKGEKYTPEWDHSVLAEVIWWGIPFLIVIFLSLITWKSSHALDPFRPFDSDHKPLKIQVVALEWKWLFLYPEQGIATVNFVEFPSHVPIQFEITADAPMNSFWIPQLGGQIYAMPAMRTQLHLMASEEGSYRGCSAQLSGDGFAGMTFTAEATTEEEFNTWVSSVKKKGKALNLAEYKELVKPSQYHEVQVYKLAQPDLFEQILMKYMMPPQP